MLEQAPKSHQEILRERFDNDHIEGDTFSFDDPDQGKSTTLKISKLNKILGAGSYASWVADVDVELANESDTVHKTHRMVLKRYRSEESDVDKHIEQSYKNYRLLKSTGIPTWDTYRINYEHKLALMTLGARDGDTLITVNDGESHVSNEMFEKNPITVVANFKEFISQVKSIIDTTSEHVLRLHSDAWGVTFKPVDGKPGTYILTPVIADLDGIDTSDNPFYETHYGAGIQDAWKRENLQFLNNALYGILPGNDEEKRAFADLVTFKVANPVSGDH